ncbi:hypothetical protein XM47_14190 [Catenovulum maritimum]|uniref:Uncharacterized protein n=1 Tax=Catenovulum maritimum TaxID=1513271 RepID=A0A0J8GUR9_9ALTE|nr:hypothetical protein XM47_14190 [Catenovulum maritimum]
MGKRERGISRAKQSELHLTYSAFRGRPKCVLLFVPFMDVRKERELGAEALQRFDLIHWAFNATPRLKRI